MLRAVVFDMDGILIDTEPVWRRVEVATFTALGVPVTEADSVQTMGIRIPEVVAHWYGVAPWIGPSVADVTAQIVDDVVEEVLTRGEPMAGVLAAMAAVRASGLRTAIASSSPLRLIHAVIERLRIGADIDVICSAEADPRGKPDPGVYLRAARLLGCAPRECLAIEDSPNGVRAALAAGMVCVAIPDPATADDPAFEDADSLVSSLTQVTPGWLQAWIQSEAETSVV